MRIASVVLLLIAFCALAFAQCGYSDCNSCTSHNCNWCPSTSSCSQFLNCKSGNVGLPSFCPASGNNGGSGSGSGSDSPSGDDNAKPNPAIPAVFTVLFAAALVGVIVLHSLRKKAVEPFVALHRNRTGPLDFSAFVHDNIATKVQSIAAGEQILWADVGIKVPHFMEIGITIACMIFGIIFMIIGYKVVNFQKFSIVFLMIMLLIPIILIIRGIHQITSKKHTSAIYLLTPSAAVIASSGGCAGGQVSYHYDDMLPVEVQNLGNGVSNVYFAEKWEKSKEATTVNGRATTRTKYTKKKIGFEMVVNPDIPAGILRDLIARAQEQHHHHHHGGASVFVNVPVPVVGSVAFGAPAQVSYQQQPKY